MLPCNWSMRSPSSIALNESACLRKASMQSVDDKAPVPTASNLGSAWFCSIPNHTKSISSGFQSTSADYNLQTDQPVWKERERHLFTHSTAAPSMRVCMCHCPTSPANPSNPGTSERASKALGIWPQRAFVPPLGSLAEQSPEDPPQLRRILKMLQIFADFKVLLWDSVSLSHESADTCRSSQSMRTFAYSSVYHSKNSVRNHRTHNEQNCHFFATQSTSNGSSFWMCQVTCPAATDSRITSWMAWRSPHHHMTAGALVLGAGAGASAGGGDGGGGIGGS